VAQKSNIWRTWLQNVLDGYQPFGGCVFHSGTDTALGQGPEAE
jgi:hypothetical protein